MELTEARRPVLRALRGCATAADLAGLLAARPRRLLTWDDLVALAVLIVTSYQQPATGVRRRAG